MTPTVLRTVVLAAVVALGSTAANGDQSIFGKKLLIKNPPSGAAGNKIVHLGKDAGIITGSPGSASDPQCSGAGSGGTSSIRIIASGGAGDVTIPLPCGGWTRSGQLYKYKDSSGATCNVVLVKEGALAKAVCKGPQVAIDVSGSMSPVTVVTTLNVERYCTTFGGSVKKDGSDDKTFLRKDAVPGGCPSVTTSTSSTTSTTLPPTCCDLGTSVCFNIGGPGDVTTCTGAGGTLGSGVCDAATGTCQGSGSGASFCCRDAAPFPCSEGPGTSESVCVSLGGTFADDSCAAGCMPSSTSFGGFGTADGQFAGPRGVAIDGSGNIFVADGDNNRVQKFDSAGAFVTKWGSSGGGNGQFDIPTGIAVDGSGNVFVSESCESGNVFNSNCAGRIQKFTNAGTFLTAWGGSPGNADGQMQNPTGVAVDGSGNVYVADFGNARIQKFTNTGTFLAKWGSFGTGDGQLNGPYGIVVDGSGNVYVSDRGNNRIQKFTDTGTYLGQWGSSGSGDGQFNQPRGVTIDVTEDVYVADSFNHRIQKFTNAGTYLAQWGSVGSGYGQLGQPSDVAVDGSGNIYVADRSNNRIQKFIP